MGIFNAGAVSEYATKYINLLKHGTNMAEKVLVAADKAGYKRALGAAVRTSRNAVFGTGTGEWKAFSDAFGATENATTYGKYKGAYHTAMGGADQTNMWAAKARLGGEAIKNWWGGKTFSGVEDGAVAHRALLRQSIVVGGGLAVGGSMLFGNRRRRR